MINKVKDFFKSQTSACLVKRYAAYIYAASLVLDDPDDIYFVSGPTFIDGVTFLEVAERFIKDPVAVDRIMHEVHTKYKWMRDIALNALLKTDSNESRIILDINIESKHFYTKTKKFPQELKEKINEVMNSVPEIKYDVCMTCTHDHEEATNLGITIEHPMIVVHYFNKQALDFAIEKIASVFDIKWID